MKIIDAVKFKMQEKKGSISDKNQLPPIENQSHFNRNAYDEVPSSFNRNQLKFLTTNIVS